MAVLLGLAALALALEKDQCFSWPVHSGRNVQSRRQPRAVLRQLLLDYGAYRIEVLPVYALMKIKHSLCRNGKGPTPRTRSHYRLTRS